MSSDDGRYAALSGPPERLIWTTDLVKRFWDGVARSRLAELSYSRAAGADLIRFLEPYLEPKGRHLDFGAGDGDLAQILTAAGYDVAALEPAPERRAELEARLGGSPHFLGTVEPESAGSFNVVVMVEVIEHILEDELDGALRLLHRLVRPGGKLIVTTPNNEDLELGMTICPITGLLYHRWQHVRSFTRASLIDLLRRYGFETIIDHAFDPTFTFTPPPLKFGETLEETLLNFWQNFKKWRVERELKRGIPIRMRTGNTLVVIARRLPADAAAAPAA